MDTEWCVFYSTELNTNLSQYHRPIDSPEQLGCNPSGAGNL